MPELKTETLTFLVNGKTIEIKKPSKLNFELNKELITDKGFNDFLADPQAFAKKFDLDIDEDLANQLKNKLSGLKSPKDLESLVRSGGDGATAWAVAAGAYSVASSKIAVAF